MRCWAEPSFRHTAYMMELLDSASGREKAALVVP